MSDEKIGHDTQRRDLPGVLHSGNRCRGICGTCGVCGSAAEKLVKIDKLRKEIIMAELISGQDEYPLKTT